MADLVCSFLPNEKMLVENQSDDCWCSKTGDVNFDFGGFYVVF